MSRSFAGGAIREIQIIADRLVPLMDGMSMDWEHELASPAFVLRDKLLAFEASLIEANNGTVISLQTRDRLGTKPIQQAQSRS